MRLVPKSDYSLQIMMKLDNFPRLELKYSLLFKKKK